MAGRSRLHINKFIISLLVCLGFTTLLFSQTKINGTINQYGNVTSLGVDFVVIEDPVQFAHFSGGDTVLLIQMKGARIDTRELSSFGDLQSAYGKPGSHEFLIIESVELVSKTITFRNNIVNAFSVAGVLQLVRVPSFNSAVVDDSDLNCMKWDSTSKTGGVLAMIVGKTLSLNRNIDVTGKGFSGGALTLGAGLCVASDVVNFDKYGYDADYNNSGFKGESPVIRGWLSLSDFPAIYPLYAKGKGANFTGGGGGNGRFSGGGGGGNYGAGGKGGIEDGICLTNFGDQADGGAGGYKVALTPLDPGIYLGGGGGASTYLSGSTASPGGSGGGIVIIICETIEGNGNLIIADGANATGASGLAGSGGGGAGGSVAIYLQDFSESALTVSAKGGKGGDNANVFGEGGGGGGGLLHISDVSMTGVTRTVTGGAAGTGGGNAYPGAAGVSRVSFVPLLNGFLFNSIRSSVTSTQVDSICSNVIPKEITGTLPVGGSGDYTYLWQKSYDLAGPPADIPASNTINYVPSSLETDTVFFRRVVKDNTTLLTDTSKWVEIKVQPMIENNIVGNPDTLCFNGDPQLIQQLTPDLIVPTTKYFFFSWQDSSATSTWGTSVAATKNYDPAAGLTETTWYRRKVTSGRCVDSTAIVRINVLENISNNSILSLPEEICYGMTFTDLTATVAPVLTGGDNVYRFKWESNINGGGWSTAAGVNDNAGYDPAELAQNVPYNEYSFRRVVFSGMDDVCVNTSAPILLRDYPVITNNSISADQTIGHDSIPDPFAGLPPANGDGTYGFLWQSRTIGLPWGSALGTNDGQGYVAAALTDTTWYRRVVNSSACSDTSNIIIVNVHKTITSNTIAFVSGLVEDSICSGSVPAVLKGAAPDGGSDLTDDYGFAWYSSPDNSTWNAIVAGGAAQDYQPAALVSTTWFRRDVTSPKIDPTSVSESNTMKITVLPLITNSITGSDIICYGTQPASLQTENLSGGDNIYRFVWQDSADVSGWGSISGGSAESYQPGNLTLPTKYKRIVFSGSNDCCADTSNIVDIGIYQLPVAVLTTLSDTICEGEDVSLEISLTGATPWKVVYKENSTPGPEINISEVNSTMPVTPATATAHTTFIYRLESVTDNNGCVATSLTGTRTTDVYKVPVPIAGDNAAICGPEYTLTATPSYGSGTWTYPSAVVSTSVINPYTLMVTVDSTFSGTDITHKFFWEELNWQCSAKDSAEITFYKRVSSIDAGSDTTIYSFDNIIRMVAEAPLVGTGKWSLVSGTGFFESESDPNTQVSDLSTGRNIYLWKVENGECSLEDDVIVDVSPITIPEGFSPNNDDANEKFVILGLDLPNQTAELIIVNGAGTVVYKTSNVDQDWVDWDGKDSNGNDLSEGTYYYLLKLASQNASGVVEKLSGFVVLKRY